MNPLLAALVAAGAISPEEAQRLNRLLSTDAHRLWAEQQLAATVGQALRAQQQRLAEAAARSGANALRQPSLWERENETLAGDMLPTLRTIASERAIVSAVGGGLEMWQATNHAVINWVDDFYISLESDALGSIPNINDVARTRIGNMINAWQRGELEAASAEGGLPQLIAAMENTFGPVRGEGIAVTEVTRVFAESKRYAALSNDYIDLLTWETSRDAVVCPTCGPLDGVRIPKAQRYFPGGLFPPAHPKCRCDVGMESSWTAGIPAGSGGAGTWTFA